jgi:hypothetical protein
MVPATTHNAHAMKRLQEQLEELPRKLSKTIREDLTPTIEGDAISASDFRAEISAEISALEDRLVAMISEHLSTSASSAPAVLPEKEGERMIGGGQRVPTWFQGPNGRTQQLPDGFTLSCKVPDLCRFYFEGVPYGPQGDLFIAPWRDIKGSKPKDQAALCKFRRVFKVQVSLIWDNFQQEIATNNPTPETPIPDVDAFILALNTWPIPHRQSLFTRSIPLLFDRAYGHMGATAIQRAKYRAQNITVSTIADRLK